MIESEWRLDKGRNLKLYCETRQDCYYTDGQTFGSIDWPTMQVGTVIYRILVVVSSAPLPATTLIQSVYELLLMNLKSTAAPPGLEANEIPDTKTDLPSFSERLASQVKSHGRYRPISSSIITMYFYNSHITSLNQKLLLQLLRSLYPRCSPES